MTFSASYALSKLLPLLVLPVGATVLILLVAAVTRRRAWIVLAALVLWAFATPPVANAVAHAVEGGQVRLAPEDVPEADAIVVLSSERTLAPGTAGVSEWNDADRFFGGLALYRAGRAPLLLFTGGANPSVPAAPLEGAVLTRYAIDAGVPPERTRSTGAVANTADEAVAIANLLRTLPGVPARPRVLLVTSAFHVPRARALFERAGMDVTAFPVDSQVSAGRRYSPLDLVPRAGALHTSERSLRELLGRLAYGVR